MSKNRVNRTNSDLEDGFEPIDCALASEEELAPTSGFLAAVMERVGEEAAAPAPIPFPWRRAVPALLVAAGVLGWGGYELVRVALPSVRQVTLPEFHIAPAAALPLQALGWIAAALAVSLVSWLFSRRLAGGSGQA